MQAGELTRSLVAALLPKVLASSPKAKVLWVLLYIRIGIVFVALVRIPSF
jgi:hypothetical protein